MDWLRARTIRILPALRQSRLVELLQRRHRRTARRSESGQPAQQRAAARLPDAGLHRPRVRHEVVHRRDRQQPHLSAPLAAERHERQGRAELRPRDSPPLARRGRVRRSVQATASDSVPRALPADLSRGGRLPLPVPRPGQCGQATIAIPAYALAGVWPSTRREQLRLRSFGGGQPAADGLSARTMRDCAGEAIDNPGDGWLAHVSRELNLQHRGGHPRTSRSGQAVDRTTRAAEESFSPSMLRKNPNASPSYNGNLPRHRNSSSPSRTGSKAGSGQASVAGRSVPPRRMTWCGKRIFVPSVGCRTNGSSGSQANILLVPTNRSSVYARCCGH